MCQKQNEHNRGLYANEFEGAVCGEGRSAQSGSQMGRRAQDVVRGERREHRPAHAMDAEAFDGAAKEMRTMRRPPFKTNLELLSETHAEKYSQSVVSDGYVKLRFSPKFVSELFSGASSR